MSEYKNRQELESKLVAKVWQDDTFKQQLMNDPKSTITEVGISLPEDIKVGVIEET